MTCIYIFYLVVELLQLSVCLFLLIYRKTEEYTLRYSKVLVIVAFLSTVFSCFISIYFLATSDSRASLAISTPFLLCSAMLLYAFCRWRVRYGVDIIEVRPLFGRKRRYAMADVQGLTEGKSSTTLHLKNGKLRLDGLVRNRQDLIEEAEYYYRHTLQKGFALPDIPERLFHGYVQNPWSFIGIFLFVDACVLAGMFLLVCLFGTDARVESADLCAVTLENYTVNWNEDSLQLSTEDLRQPYYCNDVEDLLPEEQFSALEKALQEQAPLIVLVKKENYEDAKQDRCNFLRIRALETTGGETLISRENVASSLWAEARCSAIGVGSSLLLFLGFEGWFCYIVNHAPKYPRLFRLLVKESWRNI